MKALAQIRSYTEKSDFLRKLKKQKGLLLLLMPLVVMVFLFQYRPLYGLVIAFQDFDITKGFLGSKWVGLYHFKTIFQERQFYKVFFYTIYISAIQLVLAFPAPIILALMLNELRGSRFKKFVQSVSYLPHFISWVVAGGVIYKFLLPNGDINILLTNMFNIEPIPFLSNENFFPWLVLASSIWKNMGFNSIVYLAALTAIDPQLYEAGHIDGAGKWKLMIHITLPSLIPTIITLFILNTGKIMNVGFDQIWNLQNSVIRSQTHVIDTYTYIEGIRKANMSYATAVGMFKSVISLLLIFTTNHIAKKTSENSLW